MAKFKVLKKFRDAETKEIYEEGQEIELSDERADEAVQNLSKWNVVFLERIEEKSNQFTTEELDSLTVPELKELATARNITLKVAAKKEDIIEAIQEYEKAAVEESKVGE